MVIKKIKMFKRIKQFFRRYIYMSSVKSPHSYFKNILYEPVPKDTCRKKNKISKEEFQIPDFSEYNLLASLNFNVRQLKQICKYYKQKRSGNKSQLIFRLYNFLKFSFYAKSIQGLWRGFIRRKYNRLRGPAVLNYSKCVNNTDFVTLHKLTKLPRHQFYSYIDNDKFIYGFDICSLYNLISKTDGSPKNPYNRSNIPVYCIQNINTIIRLSKLFNDKIKIELEDSLAGLSPEKKVILFAVSVFQRIDELGNNSDYRWFLSLNRLRLIRFVRELVDIWCYRANISPIVKRNICPPTGNPFIGLNINNIDLPILKLKKKILLVLNNFVVKGIDRDSKTLGALYILTALTLVSKEAAEARPELYQSATYNTNL